MKFNRFLLLFGSRELSEKEVRKLESQESMDKPVVASFSDNSRNSASDINLTMGDDTNLDFKKYFKPNAILSGEELYNYSKRGEKTIPSKGGHKDFEPDGSWLQGKKMDMFHDTVEYLLNEPRIGRQGSLLIGIWDPEKNLVEYKKDARKFWAKMGFVDENRKWLYPEEALYLMEMNSLEVYNNDVPLSLQEAYCIFFRTSANRNQYQVYGHLRRLGYSVIRHQGRSDISRYERYLKLNQYVKDGNNKKRKILKNVGANHSSKPEKDNNISESLSAEENLCKRLKTEDASKAQEAKPDNFKSFPMAVKPPSDAGRTEDLIETPGNEDDEENKDINRDWKLVPEKFGQNSQDINNTSSTWLSSQEANCENVKSGTEPNKMELEDSCANVRSHSSTSERSSSFSNCDSNKNSDSCLTDSSQNAQTCNSSLNQTNNVSAESSDPADTSGRLSPNFLSDLKKLKVLNDDDETPCKIFMYPKWNFQEYNFPNVARLTRTTCSRPTDSVTLPLFGETLPEGNLDFNVKEYRETVMNQHKYYRTSRGPTEVLEFSFENKYQNKKKEAKNWGEYKKICHLENEEKMSVSPLQVLWDDEVKPLVSLQDATSTDAILKKLKIVNHAQLHVCSIAERSDDYPENWDVVFDVYQPNAKFKKTDPGLPYFRVCVCGVDENPPSISDVTRFSRYFADDIPMNWAVVDNGEISFYIFRGVSIPERP